MSYATCNSYFPSKVQLTATKYKLDENGSCPPMSSCFFPICLSSTCSTKFHYFLLFPLSFSTSTATCTCLRLGAMAWRCLILCADCHRHANGVSKSLPSQCRLCFLQLSPLWDHGSWNLALQVCLVGRVEVRQLLMISGFAFLSVCTGANSSTVTERHELSPI